jgi:hypothetical protein
MSSTPETPAVPSTGIVFEQQLLSHGTIYIIMLAILIAELPLPQLCETAILHDEIGRRVCEVSCRIGVCEASCKYRRRTKSCGNNPYSKFLYLAWFSFKIRIVWNNNISMESVTIKGQRHKGNKKFIIIALPETVAPLPNLNASSLVVL